MHSFVAGTLRNREGKEDVAWPAEPIVEKRVKENTVIYIKDS